MGLEEDWLLLLLCTFVHCRMMASLHPCWIGTGGVEADPPRQKFSVTSVGVIFNQWGVKPPTPPTNRTLVIIIIIIIIIIVVRPVQCYRRPVSNAIQ